MPKYDLECMACAHRWEVTRRMTEDNPPCPLCGGQPVQLPSTGTGFAIRGYSARNGYAKGNK